MAAYKLYNPQKRTPHPQIHKHTHTHTHTSTHSHTRLNKLAAHPRNLICMAFQFVLCCFLLSTFFFFSTFFFCCVWFSFSFYFFYAAPFGTFFVHCLFLVCLCCICHCINFWYLRQFHSKLSAGHSRLFLMHPATRSNEAICRNWLAAGDCGRSKKETKQIVGESEMEERWRILFFFVQLLVALLSLQALE